MATYTCKRRFGNPNAFVLHESHVKVMAFLNATLHYIAMLAHLRELTARGISSNRGDLSDSQIQGLPSWSAAKHVRPRSVICSAATKRAKACHGNLQQRKKPLGSMNRD
jgi:hypothetical protein